jgi:serine/threonine protein phosphatase 1
MNDVAYPSVVRHPWNDAGRDFIVGDLHGCTDALRYLLAQVRFSPLRDRLFSVGDLVDRGEHSLEALALLDFPWFFAVLGNHEEAMCEVADGTLPQLAWDSIGGAWARELSHDALAQHAWRVRGLPLVRVIGDAPLRYNVLHAEFFGDDAALDAADFDERTRARMLWGRQLIGGGADPRVQRGLSRTYCGHTPVEDIQTVGSQVFVDTGAFARQGRLSLVDAQDGAVYTISTDEAKRRGAAALPWPGQEQAVR